MKTNKKQVFIKSIVISFCAIITFIVADWCLTASDRYQVFPVNPKDTFGKRGVLFGEIDETKKSVIIMGCSFGFGVDLKDGQTLPDKIQTMTGRKTLNLAYPAHGIQHVLYKIKNFDEFNNEVENAEYVIYIFITDHLRRLYLNYFDKYAQYKYLRYIKKNNTLIENNFSVVPLDYFKTTTIARRSNDFFYTLKSDDEKFDFLKMHILESQKELKKKNPNCKFVTIVYNTSVTSERMGVANFHTDRWTELEDEGIIVINFDTAKYDFLNEDKYIAQDELHPSEAAWDRLMPTIIRRLKL
ncbi:hypothetical protein IJD44_09560 [bacterium]|nr:hypothetical protein [bacterium]